MTAISNVIYHKKTNWLPAINIFNIQTDQIKYINHV